MNALRIAIDQFAPQLGDVRANLLALSKRTGGEDLLLTPELSLTGYDVADLAPRLAQPLTPGQPLAPADLPALATPAIVGAIDRGPEGIVYNAALLLERGIVRYVHRKIYLPTYGMFDEGRFFGRGADLLPLVFRDWRIGVLVCEDFWHPGLLYALAAQRIDALFVLAAAPGRGVQESADDVFASADVWERIARTTAQVYGIYVALANRTGVEGAVTFAGGSLIAAPNGDVVAKAPALSDARLEAVLDAHAVHAARRPYAHIRDDDVELVRRALAHAHER